MEDYTSSQVLSTSMSATGNSRAKMPLAGTERSPFDGAQLAWSAEANVYTSLHLPFENSVGSSVNG